MLKHVSCPICGRKLKGIVALKVHIYRYHGSIDYKCPVCGKQSVRGKLIMHYALRKDPEHQFILILKKRGGVNSCLNHVKPKKLELTQT